MHRGHDCPVCQIPINRKESFCPPAWDADCFVQCGDDHAVEALYVTEGEFDTAIFEQADYHAVSLPSSTTKITPAVVDQIVRPATIILAGDSDAAGTEAMTRL